MLDGWYCRSIGNYSGNSEDSSSHEDLTDFKGRYHNLKQKFKLLIYENECFQEALRSTQRQLLKTNRDKSFLMDRLLHYERVGGFVSESGDETDSSGDETLNFDSSKRKKADFSVISQSCAHISNSSKSHYGNKKKKSILKSLSMSNSLSLETNNMIHYSFMSDGHMTPEEVERHLESRQNYLELVPEKAPPTVPTEMFSNDGSLDKSE